MGFEDFLVKLKGSVGNMMDNIEDDVFNAKNALFASATATNPPTTASSNRKPTTASDRSRLRKA